MSVTLFRVNQRKTAIRALQSAHQRQEEEPISGWLIALVVVAVLAFAVGTGVHEAIAAFIS